MEGLLGILTIEGIIEGGLESIPAFLIVIVFFWGFLYTAVNYSIVLTVVKRKPKNRGFALSENSHQPLSW